MSNISYFISENLLLCSSFLFAILIYTIYEIYHVKLVKSQITSKDAINLSNRNKGIFLDVRDNDLYCKSHVIGAINRTVSEIKSDTDVLKKFKKNPLIIYCTSGNQSTYIYKLLKKRGFNNIYILQGGIKQWMQDKLPIDINSNEEKIK